jgi:hypothetical protein
MANLQKAMPENYILRFDYQKTPMYKNLRDHRNWPLVWAESNRHEVLQRDIYFREIAEN